MLMGTMLSLKLLSGLLLMTLAGAADAATVTKANYGTTKSGQAVDVYTLKNPQIEVKVITFGARITEIVAPDRDGHRVNVALGYSDLASYETDKNSFGALVGRYANRLAGGKFQIDGKTYQVPLNNGRNALHGGPNGLSLHVWQAHAISDGVEMTLVSPDGEMGFPGTLTTHVRYTLQGSALKLDIRATTDKATVVNLTNHSYFNLSGEGSGLILDDVVTIDADKFVPVDSTQIPTGELRDVAGTPFDFRTPHRVGERINAQGDPQLHGGYDHSYVVNGPAGTLREAAKAADPKSGRVLTVSTTEPAVHFYTGNALDGTATGPSGHTYVRRSGLCFETQHLPDSPNHPNFPTTELRPGKEFHATTVFAFSVAK